MMITTRVKRFLWQWCCLTFSDAVPQIFGWPTLLSAAALSYLLQLAGFGAIQDQTSNNFALAVVSYAIALMVNFFIAAFKAYRLVKPLVVTVSDDIPSPALSFNDKMRGYAVTVVVFNRSVAQLNDCAAYVMNAPLYNGEIGPFFVEKFDMPPKSMRYVQIAYWFSREAPNVDDGNIRLAGPVSSGYAEATCALPVSGADLHIRIQAQGTDSKDVQCRVWVDKESRQLKSEQRHE